MKTDYNAEQIITDLENAITANDAYLQKIETLNAEFLAAAKGVLDGFEVGVFVRNVSRDHRDDWAILSFPYLRQLGKLAKLVTNTETKCTKS
jgi:hypothetical protein